MGGSGRRALERRPHHDPLTHPLVGAVRRALPDPPPARAEEFLALLERRLAALADAAHGRPASRAALGLGRSERALARRFLRPVEGTWHDGDENRVRGHLDRWAGEGDPGEAIARSLLDAGEALARSSARAETLWFYLWEMESMLESVATPPSRRRGGR